MHFWEPGQKERKSLTTSLEVCGFISVRDEGQWMGFRGVRLAERGKGVD